MPEEERGDDARDQGEDEVRLAQVTALETSRSLDLADDEGGDHTDEHQQREHVDQKGVPTLRAKPRQRRARVDRAGHGDDDCGEEDEEAPEDGGVHQAGEQPLQQLALADHDSRLCACSGRHVVEARRRLAGSQKPVEGPGAAAEERARNRERQGQGGCLRDVHVRLRISAVIAGTTSFRSPVTV